MMGVGPVSEPGDDAVKDELAKFEGTWRHESMEIAGKAQDVSPFRETPLILKGQSFTQGKAQGTFKIDPTKTPKTIDMTFANGPAKGITLQGIYELDATTYKLCVAGPDADRPKVFDSKPKDGGSVQVLKKVKPESK
jgi:uncharacterized protein (TIGR03067 family)